MIDPIQKVRRFVYNHPVLVTSTIFAAGFVVGSRMCANSYQAFLLELDPSGKLIEKYFALPLED